MDKDIHSTKESKREELHSYEELWEIGKLLHGGDYNVDQWLDRPDILAEDIRLMKLAGVNVVSLCIFPGAV